MNHYQKQWKLLDIKQHQFDELFWKWYVMISTNNRVCWETVDICDVPNLAVRDPHIRGQTTEYPVKDSY